MAALLPWLIATTAGLAVLSLARRRDRRAFARIAQLVDGDVKPLRHPIRFAWASNRKRRAELDRSIPEAVDLLSILVTAGLNLNQGLPRVAARLQGPLAEEMKRTCVEIEMGVPRGQALEDLASRNNSERLRSVIGAIRCAERYGTPLAQALEIQAREARLSRRRRAEAQAHKAPVKLLFPLVFLILPAFLLLSVGPLALAMLK